MERTKTPTREDGKIRWRKDGGGTFRLARGKIVKPNEIFLAHPDEIPKGFRDTVIALEDLTEEAPPMPTSNKPRFELRSKSGGWYDAINTESGKPVNDKSLRASEAKELIEELS